MSAVAHSQSGVVTSPHALASAAGQAVLEQGGTAIEAAVATGAMLCVVQPQMNGLGGDAFWLIADAEGVHGIDGAGPCARACDRGMYGSNTKIPTRGPLAANTVAGLVSTWDKAFEYSRTRWQGRIAWDALLEPARTCAAEGFALGGQLQGDLVAKLGELSACRRFIDQYAPIATLAPAETFKQPALAVSFASLQREGGEGFYRGALGRRIAAGLEEAGSPVRAEDLASFESRWVDPICVPFMRGTLCNLPPPSQGLASLIILALAERLGVARCDPFSADYVHLLVEATRQAFAIRERHVADPDFAPAPLARLLNAEHLDMLAARVDPHRAGSDIGLQAAGDTVWFGAMDAQGRAVSVIQSLYFEFGSGIVAGDTGIIWQNRGTSFSLDERHINCLQPCKRPLHTLNPAMYLEQGRPHLVYGTMGGDGQPQTQAAIATRALMFGMPLDEALASPRWLLGKTWGQDSTSLKLESRFDESVTRELQARGHVVERVDCYSQLMGHAGAIRSLASGQMEAASDPRSEGRALGVELRVNP